MAEPTLDPDATLEQLDRILASPLFRNSKRCEPLLRYIVTETLDGRADALKERALGMAVFGRKPTYDTNDDPIVRSSAAEVRKRIAQYYHEPGHESELRIELTPGSYIPHFHAAAGSAAPPEPRTPAADPASPAAAAPRRSTRYAIAAAAALILVALALVWALRARSDKQSALWGPITATGRVILASGDLADAPASGPLTFAQTNQADRLGFADGSAMARVAALLGARGAQLDIRRAGAITLADLRRSPAVLIGEMSNPWTRLIEGDLRFRFDWDIAQQVVRLDDRQNPGKPLWTLSFNTPYSSLKEDRAIITRVVDPRTEHAVLILAGCGRDGTTAASEFVSEARFLDALAAQGPPGWSSRNLQVVIATDLINGHSGPPRIVAIHAW